MKRLTVSILILLSSSQKTFACFDYPFGEDIRFSIFNPKYFGFKDYAPFYFSAHSFSPLYSVTDSVGIQQEMDSGEKMNCELWRKRCKNIPSLVEVQAGVYGSGNDVNNPFVKYLYANKDTEAIMYLNFARQCTALDDFLVDPWERNENVFIPQRQYHVRTAIEQARATKDESIRLRYAFQVIRSAYYSSDTEIIKNIYNEFFNDHKEKNIIDYWALYFRTLVEPKGVLKNYYAAQVFKNAPDKRFMISMEYDKSIPINQTLRFAKSKNEKSAIWLLSAIRNPGRALESMQELAALNTNDEGLSFLLLREVNKLEDWIYTPYYTNFEPSIEQQNSDEDKVSFSRMKNRISRDRMYAQQLLDFVNLYQPKIKTNSQLWQSLQAYLMFMTQDYSTALKQTSYLQKKTIGNKDLENQIEMIKALCLTASQPIDSTIIPDEIKPILINAFSLKNQKFILAVSKELEYKGNTTDAALLLSKINPLSYGWDNFIFWKNTRRNESFFTNYYIDYFSYIDGKYTTKQMRNLIIGIENNFDQTDSFSIWKYSNVKNQLPRLYDLLGTKYIRDNKLYAALACFEKVNDTLWTSENEPFSRYLNANPFYTNFYNEHRKTKADSVKYNKESITRTLINYLNKAEDMNNKDRDYYYFLVANCYFNMTHYGNSWMMRRYWWESTRSGSDLPDGHDFFNCDFAKTYYLKAKAVTKSKKFSALCLRRAGRCEKYHLTIKMWKENDYYLPEDEFTTKLFKTNIYYRQIKRQFPNYYDDLISNCYSFDEYFNARK